SRSRRRSACTSRGTEAGSGPRSRWSCRPSRPSQSPVERPVGGWRSTTEGATAMTGLDDLLGGGSSGGSGGGLQDILGGLLGGSSGGSPGTAAGGMNLGALAAALGPLLAKLLQGGGLSKLLGNAQASGLSAQADSWV